MHEAADIQPTVVLRHSTNDDYNEKSPSSCSDQRPQKVSSQGDGKSSGTYLLEVLFTESACGGKD
jgi:hypothetical protein